MIILIICSILWVLFYGSYFLKMRAQKKRGILADRLGWGAKDASTRKLEKWLRTVTYLTGLIQLLSILLSRYFPLLITAFPIRVMGCVIGLLGTGLLVLSMGTMGDSWRAGVDMVQACSLITTGIYRYSRNPAFLGFDLFYLGFALALCSVELCAISAISIVLFHFQILHEERYLPTLFGSEYEEYRRKTPRYFWKL